MSFLVKMDLVWTFLQGINDKFKLRINFDRLRVRLGLKLTASFHLKSYLLMLNEFLDAITHQSVGTNQMKIRVQE